MKSRKKLSETKEKWSLSLRTRSMEIITKQVEMGVTDDIRPGYYSFRFLQANSLKRQAHEKNLTIDIL